MVLFLKTCAALYPGMPTVIYAAQHSTAQHNATLCTTQCEKLMQCKTASYLRLQTNTSKPTPNHHRRRRCTNFPSPPSRTSFPLFASTKPSSSYLSQPRRPAPTTTHSKTHRTPPPTTLPPAAACAQVLSKSLTMVTTLLTTYYLLLTTHYSLLTTHYSPLTTYYLLLTTHYPLRTTHHSLLTAYTYCLLRRSSLSLARWSP